MAIYEVTGTSRLNAVFWHCFVRISLTEVHLQYVIALHENTTNNNRGTLSPAEVHCTENVFLYIS
jgi:hypothetical protein